ncbi:MAG: nucleoside hydrolase [Candidatus Pacearchaeota archaeon]|jgi:purine nucleosidase
MNRYKIIETDPGTDVDDALAILYGLRSPDVEIVSLNMVYGNVDLRAKITKKILELDNKNIPVYVGESTPIRTVKPIFHFGREGEGLLTKDEIEKKESPNISSIDFLVEEINKNPGKYDLISIGAMTNIAKAFLLDKTLETKINHLYIMGGSISYPKRFDIENYRGPNKVEHNVACDVEAADILIRSKCPKTLLTYDITSRANIQLEDLSKLKELGEPEESIFNMIEIWNQYLRQKGNPNMDYCSMHDPLTLMVSIKPDLIKTKKVPIYVDNEGYTRIGGNDYLNLAVDLDYPKFKEDFLNTILSKRV